MKYFTIIFFSLLSISSLTSQNDLSFRLTAEAYTIEDNKTSVAIQIKADKADMNLADQYYRFYYDASNMELNDFNIETNLPAELYYNAEIIEHITGFDASRVGALDYDKNLGFVNLYIELSDLTTGGMTISPVDGWITVATVDFKIEDTTKPILATWAREALTKDYASAYAIVSEWIQPQVVEVVKENTYDDLYAVAKKINRTQKIDIKIGPNPTADFIKIRNTELFEENATVRLRDMNGSVLLTQDISGTSQVTINLHDYQSGFFIVELSNGNDSEIITEKIIFTRS